MERKELEAELGRLVADFRTPAAPPPRDYSMRAREANIDAEAYPQDQPVREPAGITPAEPRSWGLFVIVPAALVLIPALAYWLAPSEPAVVAAPPARDIVQAAAAAPVEGPAPRSVVSAPATPVETRIASAVPLSGAVPLPRSRPKVLR